MIFGKEIAHKILKKRDELAVKKREVNELTLEICRLRDELDTEKEKFISDKVAEGWQKFTYFSSYYGSPAKRGDQDIEMVFLFAPHVDLSIWEGKTFSHWSYGQSDECDAFDVWLEEMEEKDAESFTESFFEVEEGFLRCLY